MILMHDSNIPSKIDDLNNQIDILNKRLEEIKNSSKSYLDIIQELVNTNTKIQVELIKRSKYYTDKSEQGRFNILIGLTSDPNLVVASFELICLPGCCGIVISTDAIVNEKYRNLGLGTLLNEMRIGIAYQWDYPLILCTDNIKNIPQQKILEKNGWNNIHKFYNNRTANDVSIHICATKKLVRPLGFKLQY